MLLQKTRRLISILLVAIILTAGVIPSAFASVPAKVNSSSARAYKKASTSSDNMKIPKNLKVSITSISGSWAKVSYKGSSAYMPLKYLSPTSKVKGYAKSSTTVYNTSGKKKGTLSKGDSVYVVGTVNGYNCVVSGDAYGFVKSGTLSDSKPAVTNVKTTAVSKIDKAIMLAKSLIGRKYAASDNPPQSFDCSSFVRYCLSKAGYSIKGTAASQAADTRYAKITSTSDLKKGDVLCFDTSGNGKVDHSAIYLGNNKFIEASRNAGKVQTNTMTSWYKSHFVCARRPK